MQTFKLKPTINSKRNTFLLEKNLLVKSNYVFKSLRKKLQLSVGHSTITGHITSWHKQRGAKKKYRPIIKDTKKSKSIIVGITYDPHKNSLTTINFDLKQKKFFNDLHIKKTFVGSLINRKENFSELKTGYRLQIKKIPIGSLISNIATTTSPRGKYAKSAGTFAQLIQKGEKIARIKLPSNKTMQISVNSLGSLGTISNENYKNIFIGKAGRARNLGRRPIVRGIAMNPVDHPHGGRTNGGRPSVTPWGLPTKNKFKLKRRKRK